MKAIINREVQQFFTSKLFFLVIGCALFGLAERQAAELSFEQFLLLMMSEHYYLTYFMIPLFLVFLYKNIEEAHEFVLIRSRFYWKYFIAKISGQFINICSFVLIQFLVFFLISLGLHSENSFLVNDSDSKSIELLTFFQQYFQTPLQALFVSISFMLVGLMTVAIFFLTFHHFVGKKATMFAMSIGYVLMAVGLKIPNLNNIPFIFMNNYIVFHYNFSYPFKLVITLITIMLVLVASLFLIKYHWGSRPNITIEISRKGIGYYYARHLFSRKNIVIITGVLLFVACWRAQHALAFDRATVADYALLMFFGHGIGQVQMIDFLGMLVVNGLPLYLLAAYIEKIQASKQMDVLIRMKRKRNWLLAIIQNTSGFIALYVILFVVIMVFVSEISGFSSGGLTLIDASVPSTPLFIFKLSVSKYLDILCSFLLFFLLYLWGKNVTPAFLLVLLVNFISFIPVDWLYYMPMGISSIARNALVIGEVGVTFTEVYIILLICLSLEFIIISKLFSSKIFVK